MPDYLLWITAGLAGAAIGSFLNVCIYRWPAERSVIAPRSSCPACEAQIAWYDNIPILSYILLRGRCRRCAAPVSVQYPLIELTTSLIWLGAAIRLGFSIEALQSATLLTLLLGIAMTDAREMVIPDQFSLGGLVMGLLLAAAPGGFAFRTAVMGAAVAYAMLWIVKFGAEKALGRPALGVGDIHMMAMIGAFLGPAGAILTILLGSLLGLIIGVPVIWIRGKLTALGSYLPLGVFLAMGAAIAHAWGEQILGWYMSSVLGV